MLLDSDPLNKYFGILLHPSSLPGGSYCGTFGDSIKEWLEILSIYKISTWQFLPLSPTDSNGSPYNSPSSFALNPWLLDVNELIKSNFIPESYQIKKIKLEGENLNFFDFKIADNLSNIIGNLLVESWRLQPERKKIQFQEWCNENAWVNDYSVFITLKKEFQSLPWWNWPEDFKHKNKEVISLWEKNNHAPILAQKLIQWHLNRQWIKIKKISENKGIRLIGDLPFYVSKDSVDVWSNKSLFTISSDGDLLFQSGVPPDYFSNSGQLWGTPVYLWEEHLKTNFDWWKKRFKRQFELVDILRLDHFRALEGFWRIDGKALDAREGNWIKSPGKELLDSIKEFLNLRTLPIIAEDLGIINKDVIDLRDQFDLPGMKILQFAFDGNEDNPYLPKNIVENNCVVYTGTHDNSTTLSWWNDLDDNLKKKIKKEYDFTNEPSWKLIELGMKTKSKLFIAPLQDILCLDDDSRFNKPGTTENNWKWKMKTPLKEIKPFLKRYGDFGIKYCRK
tara:strand:- start:6190 stop:7707 length:1518 start_codon:yes stop_codon:yes gene_type:complete